MLSEYLRITEVPAVQNQDHGKLISELQKVIFPSCLSYMPIA